MYGQFLSRPIDVGNGQNISWNWSILWVYLESWMVKFSAGYDIIYSLQFRELTPFRFGIDYLFMYFMILIYPTSHCHESFNKNFVSSPNKLSLNMPGDVNGNKIIFRHLEISIWTVRLNDWKWQACQGKYEDVELSRPSLWQCKNSLKFARELWPKFIRHAVTRYHEIHSRWELNGTTVLRPI